MYAKIKLDLNTLEELKNYFSYVSSCYSEQIMDLENSKDLNLILDQDLIFTQKDRLKGKKSSCDHTVNIIEHMMDECRFNGSDAIVTVTINDIFKIGE